MTRIACAQLAPIIGEFELNAEMSIGAIRECVALGAQIVLMPELVTTGYFFDSGEEVLALAIRRDHSLFEAWADAVSQVNGVVIGGFAELGDDGFVYNSAAIVDRTGVRGVHRKSHIWSPEKRWFVQGNDEPTVFETSVGRLGVLICYELEFPEMTRSLALQGADLIAVPTNWIPVSRPVGERLPEVSIAMVAARTNHVAIACCDRSGPERGNEWAQASCVINQDGWIVAETGGERYIVVDVDLTLSRQKNLGLYGDFIVDRRPELYGVLVNPTVD